MKELFNTLGISKQAFHQYLNREMLKTEEQNQLLPIIDKVRGDHPRMGAREMYLLIQPQTMGRDQFMDFCYQQGYKLEVKRSPHRTTNSNGVIRFNNLLEEASFELTGVNQLWVSDITYYRLGERFYYLTFITDLYSRRIVGWKGSKTLMTKETTLPALKFALAHRVINPGLILHSDGGVQYYCKQFVELTKQYGIRNSMGEKAFENSHAERINGIIKNDYLIPYGPQNFLDFCRMLNKAVEMYNHQRPHKSLYGWSPVSFEKNFPHFPQLSTKRKKEAKKEKPDDDG